jgi:hypothetical protein
MQRQNGIQLAAQGITRWLTTKPTSCRELGEREGHGYRKAGKL